MHLYCDGQPVPIGTEDTALDALLRAGITVPNSCRAGACQSCLVKAADGVAPAEAQVGLKDTLRAQGYFLSCMARGCGGLSITMQAGPEVPARIVQIERLAPDVLQVWIEPGQPLYYAAGQFITLLRPDGLARSYSIANPPTSPCRLELHVRVVREGRMSGWLATGAALHHEITLRGPIGDCFYVSGKPEQPLTLVGAGTGLAPLLGILRSALSAGHTGPITLLHGARFPDGLYLREELRQLASSHPNVRYVSCALEVGGEHDVRCGALDKVVEQEVPDLRNHRVFLCGDPDLVNKLRRRVFLLGAGIKDIFADAFVMAPPVQATAPPDR